MNLTRTFPAALLCICTALIVMASGCAKTNTASGGKRIAGIFYQEDQFFRLVLFGMRDAAHRNGVELLEANSAGTPDKEIQLVNTYIAQKVDAIIISPLSVKASIPALERARASGIKVITYNTTIDSPAPLAYIESDQTDLGVSTGRAARAYIEQHLNGKARIAILAFLSQAPEQSIKRTDGFKQEVTRLPGVEIVAEQDAWLAEQAVKRVGDIITAHPDVNLIWAANEGGTVGAVMAVKNAGKAGSVVVFGTDTGDQLADFLLADDGILQAITGQQPFEIGSLAMQTSVKAIAGESVQSRISLPGKLLVRSEPDSVRAFKQQLQMLTR